MTSYIRYGNLTERQFVVSNDILVTIIETITITNIRGTVTTKAPLRVQFSPALGGGGGKGLKLKLLLGFTK